MDFWYGGNMKLKECTVFCLVMALLLLSAGTATADSVIQFGMTADGKPLELTRTSCATNKWWIEAPVVHGLSFEGVKRTDQGAYIIPANKKIVSICVPHFGFLHGIDTLDAVCLKRGEPDIVYPYIGESRGDWGNWENITAKQYFNQDVLYLGGDFFDNGKKNDGINDCYVVLCDIGDAAPLETGVYSFLITGWADNGDWRAVASCVPIYVPDKSSSKK